MKTTKHVTHDYNAILFVLLTVFVSGHDILADLSVNNF